MLVTAMTLPDPQDFPRSAKLVLYALLDALLVPLCLYLAHAMRYGTATPWPMMQEDGLFFGLMVVAGAAVSVALRMNTIKLRVIALRSVMRLAAGAAVLAVIAMVLSYVLHLSSPRSVPMIFGVVFFFAALVGRLAVCLATDALSARHTPSTRVAIYGAGTSGLQLAGALQATATVRPRFFIDDNPALQGLILAGLPVYSLARLDDMARRHAVRRVLLAMPAVERARQIDLTQRLTARGFEVQALPSYTDLMIGLDAQAVQTPINPDEVFGRETVALDGPDMANAYGGKVVLVTGAGGRIGSELCRQLLRCGPARLVLMDQNEAALLRLAAELHGAAAAAGTALVARLGNVTQRAGMATLLRDEAVEVVFHAAAYRNASLVDGNELESTRNNVIGAQVMAEVAEAAGVARFVLVSSNKTPQSDSIISATRDMAELVVQDLAGRAQRTRFSVVRLANVLGAKGALLPLMQRQIQAGGPVILPHPDATRVFVTMVEAARLVLVAGAIARGGDVYLLDPGAPRKVRDIAEHLILRTGRRVKDMATGEGDIEIRFTGLRPGEALTDVAAADSAPHATTHPQILRADPLKLSQIEVAAMLRELGQVLEAGDTARLRILVATRIKSFYHTDTPAVLA